jgi:hypothetical protein
VKTSVLSGGRCRFTVVPVRRPAETPSPPAPDDRPAGTAPNLYWLLSAVRWSANGSEVRYLRQLVLADPNQRVGRHQDAPVLRDRRLAVAAIIVIAIAAGINFD